MMVVLAYDSGWMTVVLAHDPGWMMVVLTYGPRMGRQRQAESQSDSQRPCLQKRAGARCLPRNVRLTPGLHM